MTHRFALVAIGALVLAACGSKVEPPAEQIVVRQPGQATSAAPAPAQTP